MYIERFLRKSAVVIFVAVFATTVTRGGIGPISGSEPGLFDEYTGPFTGGGCSVVVARVLDVRVRNDEPEHFRGTHNVTLEPLVLVAGLLDPSIHPKIETIAWISDFAAMAIKKPPPNGAIILVVLRYNGEIIHPEDCSFMPNESPLIVLDGLGDKRILETLERIRKARAIAVERENREKGEGKREGDQKGDASKK